MLKARNELESWASREGAFLANNWILLFSAFFILFATMFPTITEAISGERLTVGPPFFNKWMTPVGLVLLFLTGVGPLLAWRKTSPATWLQQFLWPTVSALVVGGVVVALGVRVWSSGICFALCGFVFGTITQEYLRGANVRKATSGADLLTAMIGLVGRNKRRYGGYIVHVGIVLMFLGFAGEGLSRDEQLLLKPGEEATVGDYTLHLDAIRVTDDGQKQMVTGHITVKDADGERSARCIRRSGSSGSTKDEPTTEVAIRRIVCRRPLHRDAGLRAAGADRERRSPHQPAGELDLGRLRRARDRHVHRAAAGERVQLCAWRDCRPKRRRRRCCCSALLLSPASLWRSTSRRRGRGGLVVRSPAEKAVTNKLACWCGGSSEELPDVDRVPAGTARTSATK